MEEENHLSPPMCRVGNKKRFSELLTHLLPPHTTYVEPFAGSAAIFFYKKPAHREVLNDLDKHVTSIFKIIQKISGDAVFPNIDTMEKAQTYHTHTYTKPEDILTQYLIRSCCGWMGKTVPEGGKLVALINPLQKLKHIKEYKARLRGVHITNEDYEKVINDNDSSSTVFFMDPPYEGSSNFTYANGSNRFDFDRFAKVVAGIRGKWLITINDSPYIRSLFKKFHITPIIIMGHHHYMKNNTNKLGKQIGSNDRPELLISNYALPKDAKGFAPGYLKFKGGVEPAETNYQLGDARRERERIDAEIEAAQNRHKQKKVVLPGTAKAEREKVEGEIDTAQRLNQERSAMVKEAASEDRRRAIINEALDKVTKLSTKYSDAEKLQKARFITRNEGKELLQLNKNLVEILEWLQTNVEKKELEKILKFNEMSIPETVEYYKNKQKSIRGWGVGGVLITTDRLSEYKEVLDFLNIWLDNHPQALMAQIGGFINTIRARITEINGRYRLPPEQHDGGVIMHVGGPPLNVEEREVLAEIAARGRRAVQYAPDHPLRTRAQSFEEINED